MKGPKKISDQYWDKAIADETSDDFTDAERTLYTNLVHLEQEIEQAALHNSWEFRRGLIADLKEMALQLGLVFLPELEAAIN